MTDLATGAVRSIVPRSFKVHPLVLAAVVVSFFLATVLTLLAMFDGWPVRYAAAAIVGWGASFIYVAVRKWNAEGWPESLRFPIMAVEGVAVFFFWWAMSPKEHPEKRQLILKGRTLTAILLGAVMIAFATGGLALGCIILMGSVIAYGMATYKFIAADSDEDEDEPGT